MKKRLKYLLVGLTLPLLLLVDLAPDAPFIGSGREAAAVIGRPLTPISYAGVARRTTRRAVAVGTTAVVVGTTAATDSTTTAAPAPTQAPAPAGAPPVGSIVTALPAGCVSTPVGGVEYYNCAGVYYRPAFQGNNLVYVVQNP